MKGQIIQKVILCRLENDDKWLPQTLQDTGVIRRISLQHFSFISVMMLCAPASHAVSTQKVSSGAMFLIFP